MDNFSEHYGEWIGGGGDLFIPLSNWKEDSLSHSLHFEFETEYGGRTQPESDDWIGIVILSFLTTYKWCPVFLFCLGPYIGFYKFHFLDHPPEVQFPPDFQFVAGISLGLEVFRPFGTRTIPSPSITIKSSFSDDDGNGVLSENENGKMVISLSNKGDKAVKGRIYLSFPDEILKYIDVERELKIGTIYSAMEVEVPLKGKRDIPAGEWKVKVDYSGKSTWGEHVSSSLETILKTAPRSGMIMVAFKGIEPKGMPRFVVPTPPEHAEYSISYSQKRLVIRNLHTGESREWRDISINDAMAIARNYFSEFDRENPKILSSIEKETVRGERVILKARFSDDRKIERAIIYLNEKVFKEEAFTERSMVERNYEFPLQMDENRIRFVAYDWVGKKSEKEITLIRLHGKEEVIDLTGGLPQINLPRLEMRVSLPDNENLIRGGRRKILQVHVRNSGNRPANLVSLRLTGSELLRKYMGEWKKIGTIPPGEERVVNYEGDFPSFLPKKEEEINISLYEGSYEGALKTEQVKFRTLPEDVDRDVPERALTYPERFALIIGISNYQKITPLKYARRDAETFRNYAETVLGVPRENIRFLSEAEATLGSIRSALDWLSKKSGTKIVYFSGHGVPDPDNPKNGKTYFVPWDGEPSSTETLIPRSEIETRISEGGNGVLIADACFSGVKALVPQKVSDKVISISSSGNLQPSLEFDDAEHSYFTYFFLLGLKGKADKNGDGRILVSEIAHYVKENVESATEGRQSPFSFFLEDIILGSLR